MVKKNKLHVSRFKLHELAFSQSTFYDPAELMEIPIAELKKEYTRLRDISQKRIKRLGESDYRWSEPYQYHEKGFPKIKDLSTPTELRAALSDVSKFVNTESTTISGQDALLAKRVQTLKEHKVRTRERYPLPETKEDQIAFFYFVDWMNKTVAVDYFYDLSTAERRKLNQKKISELIRSGKYREAYDKMKGFMTISEQLKKEKAKQKREQNKRKKETITYKAEQEKKRLAKSKEEKKYETLTDKSIKGFDSYYGNQFMGR